MKQARKTDLFRRSLLAVALGLTTFSITKDEPVRQISFQEARKNRFVRQSYIDQVVRELDVPRYISAITYVTPENRVEFEKGLGYKSEPEPDEVMRNFEEVDDFQMDRYGITSRIAVFPLAFEREDYISSDLEFKLVLGVHEFQHAKQHYGGMEGEFSKRELFLNISGPEKGKINWLFADAVTELEASEKELLDPRFPSTSANHKNAVISYYGMSMADLRKVTTCDSAAIKKVVKRYTPTAKKFGLIRRVIDTSTGEAGYGFEKIEGGMMIIPYVEE